MYLILFFTFIFSPDIHAQIANASFFPSVRSINPGVSHLREQGFLSLDSSKTSIKKHQDIQTGGILDGISTDVELNKTTFFRAGKGPGITIELLLDQEDGERTESFATSNYSRTTTTSGKSSVMGGILDLGLFGVMMSKAKYTYFYDFHVDEVPNLNRETHDFDIDYDLLRFGFATEILNLSIGAFYSVQTGEGSVDSILYNPTTGAKNTPEVSTLEYETIMYGAGIGYKSKQYHLEISLEQITEQSGKQSNDYLYEIVIPEKGSRLSFVGEIKLGKIGLGFRVRQINGNFNDIEELISSNMLYLNTDETTSRLENSLNFSYGSGGGFSFSGFYSTSKSNTQEESELLDNDIEYDTTLESTAYGISISYIY